MELSPIFCPKCDRYVGLRAYCACGQWTRDVEVKPAQAGVPIYKLPTGEYIHSHPLITGDKLIFTYGWRGQYAGGALVLDRNSLKELWQCEVGACVEGGAALYENNAIFGDAQGRVYSMRLDIERRPMLLNTLDGAIRAAPLVSERRLYVATLEGVIACLDARSGVIVRQSQLGGVKGAARIASAPVMYSRGALFGALDGGLYLFDAESGRTDLVFKAEAGIYTSPILHDGRVIITTERGDVVMVDPRNRKGTSLLKADNLIRAAPLLADGILYVASHDHRLYAIDVNTGRLLWRFECEHGLSTTPLLINGLVIVADSHGHVMAVEPPTDGSATGKRVWQTSTQTDQPDRESVAVFGRFLAEGEQIVFGSFDGCVYALPWHLGNYELAIRRAEQMGKPEAAATYAIMAGGPDAARKAAELLSAAQMHAKAARIYEWHSDRTKAALEYEKAATTSGLPVYWRSAAGMWTELKQHERARQCLFNAARAGKKPWLDARVTSASQFRIGEKGWLNLIISNELPAKACNLKLRLEGGTDWSVCEVFENPELTDAFPWPVACKDIRPLFAGERPLQLVISYEDEWGNGQEQSRMHVLPVASLGQPPIVYNNAQIFNGETHIKDIKGDAVVMDRGADSTVNRIMTVGGDRVEITGRDGMRATGVETSEEIN